MSFGMLRRSFVSAVLFVIGLALGAVWFLPWDTVWTNTLQTASEAAPRLGLQWRSVSRASAFSFTVTEVNARVNRTALYAPVVTVDLGVAPLVTLLVDTQGSVLRLEGSPFGSVSFDGDLDLGVLMPESGVEGLIRGAGEVELDTQTWRPVAGETDMSAPALVLPGNLRATDLTLQATLEGDTLAVTSFTAVDPMPLEASGVVTMNWANIPASNYDITGLVTVGDSQETFARNGALRTLMQQGVTGLF